VAVRDARGRFLTRPEGSGSKKGSKNRETLVREHAEAQAAQAKLEAEIDAVDAEMTPKDFMLRGHAQQELPV
jgi:hypothetical protein